MTKRKRRNDEAFFRRVKAEFPELFEAKLTVELDETLTSNPDKRVIARHRKKTKTNTNRKR